MTPDPRADDGTAPRGRPVLAATVAVLALLVAAAGMVEWATDPGGGDWSWTLSTVLAYAPAGVLLARTAPRLAGLFLVVATSAALALLAGEHAALAVREGGLPGDHLAVWVSSWSWVPFYVVVAGVLPYLLPDGRAHGRWAWGARFGVLTCAVGTLGWAVAPYDELDEPSDAALALGATNPVGVEGAGAVIAVSLVLLVVAAVGGLTSAVVRWRRAEGVDRSRLAWVLLGVVATAALLAAAQATPGGSTAVLAVAALPLPLTVLVAVLRHGLWDRDRVLGRALVWLALSAAVAVAFVAVVALLGGLLGERVGAPVVAAALVSLLVLPLLRRLQEGVSRLLYGDRVDPHEAVGRLAERLTAVTSPQAALVETAEGVAQALQLDGVRLVVVEGPTSSWGETGGEAAAVVPLVHAGEVVGELHVSGTLSPGGRRLLEALATQAGAVAHAARLESRLQRARGRTEEAREEERRRLRRDLHDSLGPALAGIALQLEHLPDVVATDPEAAAATARRLTGRVQDAVVEVRRLVEGLGSARDLGVVEALRAQVEAFDTPSLRSSLEADAVGDLPAAVEAVVLRVVGEALHNASRHARAEACLVRVRRADAALVVTVTDDGVGLGRGDGATRGSGVGLPSMALAAAELGGECTVRATAPSGTEVRLVLPLPESP